MTPVEVIRGEGPVVLGQPHGGTFLPQDVARRLNPTGRALADTDWHIARLYDGLLPGATVVRATFHRYVIDANRPPSGESLYPGQNSTGLVPLTDFDGRPIWQEPPDAAEVARRLETFHAPYHAALAAELERVRAGHGFAILWDCHSIRSEIPFLFEGRLPDLNIGTNGGISCDPALEALVAGGCGLGAPEARARPGLGRVPRADREAHRARTGRQAERHDGRFTAVLNGRFRGGWCTRHYGRPAEGLHAIQMEIAQRAYLATEAPPWAYSEARAAPLRAHLARILAALAAWRPA
ncbi:MAG: N-formylglutamate amidohydrolase [Rhodobacteraceae bacterium]|nr:N-formylglutamate amidohydrolase [Paracoccaceae bacterium]